MKRLFAFLSLISLASILPLISCSTSPYTPAGPTPTPTPAPAFTISVNGSFRYSTGGTGGASLSAPLTITAGQSVMWDTSSNGLHPLYIDNGAGTCSVTANTTFPYTHIFSSTGDFTFHCGNHGTCTGGPAVCTLPCSLMFGSIHVQ